MIQLWADLWSFSLEFYCCFSFTTGTSIRGADEEPECSFAVPLALQIIESSAESLCRADLDVVFCMIAVVIFLLPSDKGHLRPRHAIFLPNWSCESNTSSSGLSFLVP